MGHQLDSVVREAFRYGAQEVVRIDHPALADYRTGPYSRLLTELVT